jgi:uncharacterized protein
VRSFLFLLLCFVPLAAAAVPPPPVQVTANCDAPAYASDFLVCADAALRQLDAVLAQVIVQRIGDSSESAARESDHDWFRRSRMCAFEADHRECLRAAYCARIALLSGGNVPSSCDDQAGDYLAASSISSYGFARNHDQIRAWQGKTIRLWGFVDHQNLYGDESAREILGEWWSGYGPDSRTWRFNLKAKEDDPAGRSFAVFVAADPGRDKLLKVFLADARAGRPTKVYLEGSLSTFDAPANLRVLHGLRMELQTSRDIRLTLPERP